MRLLSLMVMLAVASVRAQIEYQLRCHPHLCFNTRYMNYSTMTLPQQVSTVYDVEGHKITFYANYVAKYIKIHCNGWEALDSASMPRFTTELRVSILELDNCPPPANQSYVEAFANLNISLKLHKLKLKNLSITPQLTSQHFNGIENLIELQIHSLKTTVPQPESGFLSSLKTLQVLVASDVKISIVDLQNLPHTLNCLSLFGAAMDYLPKTLRDTLNLLTYPHQIWLGESFPAGLYCPMKPKNVNGSSVEDVELIDWNEDKVTALKSCNSLRKLTLNRPEIRVLPDRWLAECPNLEELTIRDCRIRMSLSATVLEGSSIKKLTVSNCDLVTPDRWWLKYAHDLVEVTLPWNRITTV